MPLLDIATQQSLFRNNNLYSIGYQTIRNVKFISGNPKTARLSYFHNPVMKRGRFVIRSVATLEPVCSDKEKGNVDQVSVHSAGNLASASEEKGVQDEKEGLRRNRISKANKGRQAWNKGIKHSAETRQKIRERTRLAMRSPEVKMKLIKGIYNQSEETKLKIAAAVRLKWDKRRYNRRMMLRCHREWLDLIAEASRQGFFCDEEELQWDSYEIMKKQCEMEFQEGIKARKENRGNTPGRRSPKSPEQRKKISEAIAAKWADPTYRDRVYCGMAKRRGSDPVTRKPEWGTKKEPKKPVKKREKLYDSTKVKTERPNSKTRGSPVRKEQRQARFKDPQARHKLEMIKSIRAQRAVSDPKISEEILRANVFISEAQRAAKALEEAAAKSPMAEASLIETRKLIAEAISYIKSIEMSGNGIPGAGSVNEEIVEGVKEEIEERGVNGVGSLGLNDTEIATFNEVAGNGRPLPWSESSLKVKKVEADDVTTPEKRESVGKGRRWVCGRLVDDEDENEE